MGRYNERFLWLTLRHGTVYYCQDRRLSSPEPHYFVVCNASPLSARVIVLACSSSQIASVMARRAGLPAETLVEIPPTQYGPFTKRSIIDCNVLFETTRREVLVRLNAGEIECKPDMPTEIMERVRQGILASPLIAPELKRFA